VVLDQSTFYVDIMFRKLKLVIEIDGRQVVAMVREAIKTLSNLKGLRR